MQLIQEGTKKAQERESEHYLGPSWVGQKFSYVYIKQLTNTSHILSAQ